MSRATPKRSLHRKFKEAIMRAGFKTNAPNNLSVSCTRLIFQEKINLKQREIGGS
jgi:hypothetical protein